MREERTASCKMTTDAIFARESCLRAATGLRKEEEVGCSGGGGVTRPFIDDEEG